MTTSTPSLGSQSMRRSSSQDRVVAPNLMQVVIRRCLFVQYQQALSSLSVGLKKVLLQTRRILHRVPKILHNHQFVPAMFI